MPAVHQGARCLVHGPPPRPLGMPPAWGRVEVGCAARAARVPAASKSSQGEMWSTGQRAGVGLPGQRAQKLGWEAKPPPLSPLRAAPPRAAHAAPTRAGHAALPLVSLNGTGEAGGGGAFALDAHPSPLVVAARAPDLVPPIPTMLPTPAHLWSTPRPHAAAWPRPHAPRHCPLPPGGERVPARHGGAPMGTGGPSPRSRSRSLHIPPPTFPPSPRPPADPTHPHPLRHTDPYTTAPPKHHGFARAAGHAGAPLLQRLQHAPEHGHARPRGIAHLPGPQL